MRLKDKVAIITGAGMGMGREASVLFASEGAKVVVFDINEAAAKETADQITANGGEALVVVAAILLELTLPLTPAQVLWINMVTSGTLGLALAFEPAEDDVMRRRPRAPGEPLLSGLFVWRVVMVSVLMMCTALGLFLWELARGTDIGTARTMAVSAIVAAEMFYLLNSRFVSAPALSRRGLRGNPMLWWTLGACLLLQLAYVYLPPLQAVFGSEPLEAGEWARVVGAGLAVFVAAELEKLLRRRRAAAALLGAPAA